MQSERRTQTRKHDPALPSLWPNALTLTRRRYDALWNLLPLPEDVRARIKEVRVTPAQRRLLVKDAIKAVKDEQKRQELETRKHKSGKATNTVYQGAKWTLHNGHVTDLISQHVKENSVDMVFTYHRPEIDHNWLRSIPPYLSSRAQVIILCDHIKDAGIYSQIMEECDLILQEGLHVCKEGVVIPEGSNLNYHAAMTYMVRGSVHERFYFNAGKQVNYAFYRDSVAPEDLGPDARNPPNLYIRDIVRECIAQNTSSSIRLRIWERSCTNLINYKTRGDRFWSTTQSFISTLTSVWSASQQERKGTERSIKMTNKVRMFGVDMSLNGSGVSCVELDLSDGSYEIVALKAITSTKKVKDSEFGHYFDFYKIQDSKSYADRIIRLLHMRDWIHGFIRTHIVDLEKTFVGIEGLRLCKAIKSSKRSPWVGRTCQSRTFHGISRSSCTRLRWSSPCVGSGTQTQRYARKKSLMIWRRCQLNAYRIIFLLT